MAKASSKKKDKLFLISVLVLTVVGFFIFTSASLGLLNKSEDMFKTVALNQLLFGLIGGLASMFAISVVPYEFWKKFSMPAFILSSILTALVFVPGIGWMHGGANRWIHIGSFNLQPSEILKIGYVIYLAAIFSKYKNKIASIKYGFLPFILISSVVGIILVLQPDNDTFFMIFFAGLCMYYVAGARKKHILILVLMGVIGMGVIFLTRPYVRDRVMTFINPSKNPLTSGYQIQQSLIAIGSGGLMGKGFGQSTQKFSFLPEAMSDSIFAVAGEEFGFLGSVLLIVLFLFFTLRGLKIAANTEDLFGRLTIIGLVILIITGSFFNIAAMLAILPLSGTPLLFVSHGGTALFLTLAEVGIILNISKNRKVV